MKKVLILGSRSFVATGLYPLFKENQIEVNCFSRGKECKNNDFVEGDVYKLHENKFLQKGFDTVINFVLIKDGTLENNIAFIHSLVKFCKESGVKHLVHFSSIMVYENGATYIDEKSPVEMETMKRGYGEIKIEVDRYLESLNDLPFSITFIRPGYVLAADRPCPFLIRLPFNLSIIKGDKLSVQPIVRREDIHQALLNMIAGEYFDPVFLFTPDKSITKYEYAKRLFGGMVLGMPRWLVLGSAGMLRLLGIMKADLYVRVEGMYIRSIYNSSFTLKRLNIKF